MPVLILAIASFLIFVTAVVLLCIADTLESRTIRRNRELIESQPLALLSIAEAYNPVYSALWEAPIAALELIESAGLSGVPAARLRPIYEQAAARFPEIYDGCSFLQWVQFLEATRLIAWLGFSVVVTPDGHAFLRFHFITDALVEA